MENKRIKCTCYECGKDVSSDIEKHFTAEDGRILCDKCSEGVEPCSDETKKLLIDLEKND